MELVVFILGGTFYGFVELIFRGYTHWSMVLTGGAIVLTFYYLIPYLYQMSLLESALLGALIITCYEFVVGILVNIVFKWDVWDYSDRFGNILGQICPLYTLYWFGICLAFFALIKYNKGVPF
ncbi:MAG: hypothetical protein PUB87_01490 [Eubacteriaceae bacterium]|nr:hypothetical protein [Eubacteriaceae bacterium]